MRKLLILLYLTPLLFFGSLQAAPRIELIELQQRTAADMKPLIQPLLRNSETLTGSGFQLIIKAEPERIEELRAVISRLDAKLHQLRISVKQGELSAADHTGAGIKGRVTIEDGDVSASGHARILSTESRRDESGVYHVNAQEGTPVYIAEGVRFPVTTTTTQIINGRVVVTPDTQYESASSGFYAQAWLRPDNRVYVELAPRREALVPEIYGAVSSTSISTRLQGSLSEWIAIGGVSQDRNQDDSGIAYRYQTQGRDDQQVWLKVEIIE